MSNRPSAAMVLPHIKPASIANYQAAEAPANVLVAALDAALASRAFKSEDVPAGTGSGRTSQAGPN